MNTNRELSIEIAYRIAKFMNHQIESHGETKINNKEIWHGFLHNMHNEVWMGIVELWEQLLEQHPELFKHWDERNIQDARAAIEKYSPYYEKVLDMKNRHLDHKKIAWRLLMTTREVWNRCCDIHLPNSDASKVLNTFDAIMQFKD